MKVFEIWGNNLIEKWCLRLRSGTGATLFGKLSEKSGWKDSGMYGGKKMLFGGVFSTRHKHITTPSL